MPDRSRKSQDQEWLDLEHRQSGGYHGVGVPGSIGLGKLFGWVLNGIAIALLAIPAILFEVLRIAVMGLWRRFRRT